MAGQQTNQSQNPNELVIIIIITIALFSTLLSIM